MADPPKPAPTYVSPAVLAGRILARARAGEHVSESALTTAQRIEALSFGVAQQLATHEAPYRVATWVAWAKLPSDVFRRAELAVLLRRARPSKGWPDTGHLKVAFDVFLQARVARYGRSGMSVLMSVSDVPVEHYTAAIDALPKRRRRRAAEESDVPPVIVAESDVLRALVEARPPKRPRPPVIKLRTTPLRTDAKPAAPRAAPAVDVDRVLVENARLRAQRQEDELEAERQKELHRREIAELTAKVEALQSRSGGPPAWVVLGSAAAGAVATEIVRRGVDLLHAGDAQAPGAAVGSLDGEALLGRLLDVFDNLARAQQHAEQGAPASAIAEGLRIVQGQLDEALARSGVERVPTVGQLFDPSRHAAVEHIEATEPAGVVLREVLPGYMAGGRLLRAPSVVVSKGRAG